MAESPADRASGAVTTEPRGADLRVDLQLTFEEAAVGCRREIALTRNESCGGCEGSGFVPGTSVADCGKCFATGWTLRRQGGRSIKERCMSCVGGKVGTACNACGGEGVHSSSSGVSVTIPAGVEDGQVLRMLGKGDAIRGGKPGYLYVLLAVQPHPWFTRRGGDLIVEIEIAPELAASGGRVTVPLLVGEREVDIRAGTRTGDQIVLRGWGVQLLGAPPTPMPSETSAPYREIDTQGRGDLIVQLGVHERGFGAWLRRLLHRGGSQ